MGVGYHWPAVDVLLIFDVLYIRGLQYYTFFGISSGIKRRMIDIAK